MILGSRVVQSATLAVICAASVAFAHAQKQAPRKLSRTTIEVGGVNLHLGMSKEEVAAKLVGQEITKVSENDWMLGSLKTPMHTLQFTSGLLTYADRQWDTHDNDSSEALFGAVTSLNGEGFSQCTVIADTHASPTLTAQRVSIVCGEYAPATM